MLVLWQHETLSRSVQVGDLYEKSGNQLRALEWYRKGGAYAKGEA